mmetsp:Transcript_2695/g.5695  ORF Transcript_2695/g.5695 Transcript_2695/m.5695 type:complete len:491 (+) Transcript_2695:2-1474(+)
MGGKGRRGIVPGFARGRGSAAFRDPNAEVDPSAVPCGENPAGIFLHRGALYISESVDDRVVCIKDGVRSVVAGGNGKGRRPDQLDRPFRIFVDDEGVYIADRNNARVQLWRHGASSGETVAGGNSPGHGNNQLNQPAGVAVNNNQVYVADRANHRVMRWSRGSLEGVLVAGGNGFGRGSHQLGCPGALCLWNSALYISDESGARVQRWALGDKHGTTVAGGQGNGSNPNQLYHPLGVTLMDEKTLLVCDATNHRVQRWKLGSNEPDFSATTICGGFGIESGPGQLGHCMDCFWDGKKLYVSDWYHACIRTYTEETLECYAKKAWEQQAHTECDGKRYTGRVVEWRDHGGYGFIVDDTTGRRFMAHNSDIANSLVRFGYAILTQGEQVEYYLLRDTVGKWKCDAVTAISGGPVSSEQDAVDMSINSGQRHGVRKSSSCHREGHGNEIDQLNEWGVDEVPGSSVKVDKVLETSSKQGKGRRWRPKDSPLLGS